MITGNSAGGQVSLAPILVTGSNGQLGGQLFDRLGARAVPIDIDTLDLTRFADVGARLLELRPAVVINTAAYTAVDAAEKDEERCYRINKDVVANLAEITHRLGCRLVQISTDYVFCHAPHPGRPFRESDPISPAGVYATSKSLGETAALANPQHLIVRTCGIYGPPRTPRISNFVNTMLRVGRQNKQVRVVNDQVCCPTWVTELSDAILHLVDQQATGLYHVVNSEPINWHEFTQEIFRIAKIDCDVIPISSAEYGALAPRPAYSALDSSKYAATGGPQLSTCKQAVAAYLATA